MTSSPPVVGFALSVDALSVRLLGAGGVTLRAWPRGSVSVGWRALAREVCQELGPGGAVRVVVDGDVESAAEVLAPLRVALESSGCLVEGLYGRVRGGRASGEVLVRADVDGLRVEGAGDVESERVLGESDAVELQLAVLHSVMRMVSERSRLDLDAAGLRPEVVLRWLHAQPAAGGGSPVGLEVGGSTVRVPPEAVRASVESASRPLLAPLVSSVSSRSPSRVVVTCALEGELSLCGLLRESLPVGVEVRVETQADLEASLLRSRSESWQGGVGRAGRGVLGAKLAWRRLGWRAWAASLLVAALGGWGVYAQVQRGIAERSLAQEKQTSATLMTERDGLATEKTQLQGQLDAEQKKSANLNDKLTQLQRQLDAETQKSAKLTTERDGLASEKTQLQGQLAAETQKSATLNDKLTQLQGQLDDANRRLAAAAAPAPAPAAAPAPVPRAAASGPWFTVLDQAPDPKVVYDASLRSAIAATGLTWRVRDNRTQVEMVLVPPGKFRMGCSRSIARPCWSDESPIREVTITKAFYMGRYELTQSQWEAVMGSNPSHFKGEADSGSRPVERVSWDDIQRFLGRTGLRLPTEAEWEYACRAGTAKAFHGWPANPGGTDDDNQLGTIAWFDGNAGGQTWPVGQKAANGFGLHDMSGNVWEWVSDWYADYPPGPATDPLGPASGPYRVSRGGSWLYDSSYCRSSSRNYYAPSINLYSFNGFRVARAP